MEMQQIRYFLAAAQELNFTRAAAKCRVSQPSLTRAIGLLESELGGDLFRRERNLTHLTELGRRMLPLLTKAIEGAEQAAQLAKSIGAGKVASLCLALPEGVSLDPFVPHLLQLAKTFPEFDFKIRRGILADLRERLREGDVDLMIGPKPEEDWERFEYWPLFQRSFRLVFRADHPLAQQETIHAQDLLGAQVLQRPYCGISTEVCARLALSGVNLASALEFARDEDLLTFLGASQCIAILPNDPLIGTELTARKLEGAEIGNHLHAITVFGRQRGAALNLFIAQLRAAAWQADAA